MIQAQLEDGRILEFPDGTDPSVIQSVVKRTLGVQDQPQPNISPEAQNLPPEQQQALIEARRRQQEAGGLIQPGENTIVPGSVKRAQAMEQLRKENPYLAQIIEETSGPERVAVGFQSGLRTIGRGAGKLVGGDFFQDVNDPALQKLQDVSVGAQVGKIAGEAAPFAALAPVTGTVGTGLQLTRGGATLVPQITSTGGRALASGALTGTEAGTIAAGQDKSAGEIALSTLLGGAFGASAEVLIPVLNRGARKALGKLGFKGEQVLDAAGDLTPDAQKVLSDSGVEIDTFLRESIEEADIGDQARREAFEKLGITPTQAQVTRDKDLFSEQVEAFTQQGKVTEAIERQDRIIQELTQKEIGSIGGVAERSNQAVSNAIIDKAVQLDDEIGNLYRAAREAAPDAKNVRFNSASASLRSNAPSDDLSGGVIKAINGKMEQMGVIDGFKPSGRVSVESAEELRKFANSLIPSTNDRGRMVIREFKDSLDDDALSSAGGDFFKQARAAKASFEQGLSTSGKSKFSKRKKSLVRDILEEKIPEDKIADRIIKRGSSYDAKSLMELREYLTSGSENQIAQGVEAWNDIRSQALKGIFEDAFKGPITRDGVQGMTRAGLESGIKKIGPEKYNVLFSPAERGFLEDLAKVAVLREPPPGVRPSPSGPAIRKLQSALSKIPWLGGEVANDIIDSARSKASEQRVLKLIDMAEEAARKNNKMFEDKIRKSTIGKAITTAPLIAVPVAAEDEE